MDPVLDFTKKSGSPLAANAEAEWNGTLTVPSAGSYWIYLQLLGAAGSVSIDGKHVAGANGMRGGVHGDTVLGGKDGLMPTTDGLDNLRVAVDLTAGAHSIDVTVEGDTSNDPEQIRLSWMTPEQRKADHEAAIAAAKAANTAVVFAWTRGRPDFATTRRSGQADRRNSGGESQHDRRAQREPADRDAVARSVKAVSADVVAGR